MTGVHPARAWSMPERWWSRGAVVAKVVEMLCYAMLRRGFPSSSHHDGSA